MRVLLIGPTGGGGSLPPYLDVLAFGLRQHGATVDRLGTPGVPFDVEANVFWSVERIVAAAERLLSGVDLSAYDVLSVHFGNLEIEQVLPMMWADRRRPPAVYHVHSLDWTLFSQHTPEPTLRSAVDHAISAMDGFVYFGQYAHAQIERRCNVTAPGVISWLPTTIPPGTRAKASPALHAALVAGHGPIGSLYGYAAPWKDPAGLLAACQQTKSPCRVLLAGPSWGNPHEAGTDLTREATTPIPHGAARVRVLPIYLRPHERKALAQDSDFALFPYRHQPTFQGSGAIADYLVQGTPVLATDVANMTELVGDAGHIIAAGDTEALAQSIDRLAADRQHRKQLRNNAKRRARRFSVTFHAAQCLRLYETAIANRRGL